jgi:hypothetical protein
MGVSVQTILQSIRDFWSSVTGQSIPGAPAVVLHDPAAQRAHDLDDPFFDGKVQRRMAEVIADAARKEN